MAEVSKSPEIPPHLRARAAARARRLSGNPALDEHVRKADGKDVIAKDLSSRELRPVNKDAELSRKTQDIRITSKSVASLAGPKTASEVESVAKTHTVRITPTAITSSTGSTSREPSAYLKMDDLKTRFGSLDQATDDIKQNHSHVHGNRSRRRNRSAKNKRESAWAHNKHIPKGNDGRWDTNWDCPDIYEPPMWKTNPNSACGGEKATDGDDQPLNSWNGGWGPAPLNWDSRPAFRKGQSALLIEGWIVESDKALGSVTPDHIVLNEDAETTACNIAPRYWMPHAFGKQPPQSFWNDMIKSEPLPIDESDLETATPWWETYSSPNSLLLYAYPAPIISRVDPDENLHERLARENDHGSKSHAQNRIQLERAKRDAAETQRRKVSAKERRLRQKLAEQQQHDATIHLPLKPKIKMYIRFARLDDMPAICTIYNFYITQTCSSSKTLPMDTTQMTERFRNVQKNSLPFIVACERGKTMRATKKRIKRREDEDIVLPDAVVGFAYAECYSNINDAYRYSVSAEIYMVSSHYRKGVANCLMDKLLACLDPEYIERRGYNVTDEELACAEPERPVQSIMISIPYDDLSPHRMQWTKKWLVESFGFDNHPHLRFRPILRLKTDETLHSRDPRIHAQISHVHAVVVEVRIGYRCVAPPLHDETLGPGVWTEGQEISCAVCRARTGRTYKPPRSMHDSSVKVPHQVVPVKFLPVAKVTPPEACVESAGAVDERLGSETEVAAGPARDRAVAAKERKEADASITIGNGRATHRWNPERQSRTSKAREESRHWQDCATHARETLGLVVV
nr:phosphinothricin n-acetyltransferase [Quercus suber]